MKESKVQDYLCENFNTFHKKITNIEEYNNEIKMQKKEIFDCMSSIKISDLVKLILVDKVSYSTRNIEHYKLIDSEFPLLNTGSKSGKQPSVDILAYNKESLNLALIELKISKGTEREAITELSAYNLGLQNRFQGLSNLQVIWIPISTEWRVTPRSAIEYSMLWNNIQALPLHLDFTVKDEKIQNLKLKIINPIKDVKEKDYRNLFSYECFDTFEYFTRSEVKNKDGFINYITTIFNRQNINGFVIFHNTYRGVPYPHGFTLCIYNPYKGHLHRKMLKEALQQYKELQFDDVIKMGGFVNTDYYDIDFKTDELRFYELTEADLDEGSLKMDAYWEKDFLSVGDFIDPGDDANIGYVIHNLMKAIDSSKENKRAFGTPHFETLFKGFEAEQISSVSYLGIYHDLMTKKIQIEHKRKIHLKDFFSCLTSFVYLKDTFSSFN
ncbi:hypothetical protein V2E39_12665 [Chryseobacterium arthrosphaerae]|uniref:Uncharacterized protein n=1 Tax=Chryseobacterium arthrosphaerae TaxID=651561 RepID=A0ABU7R089_9FLAO|nr:hypothetical protein [Chryseobacterium arthrosphaerae]